jgi:periplasmic protein TonB
MTAQEEVQKAMSAERPISTASHTDEPISLLVPETSVPWHKSFIANIKDLVRPAPLPPLEVTSKPVPVKDIWGESKNTGTAGISSMVIHMAAVGALLALGTNETVQQAVKESVTLIAPDIAPYVPAPPKKNVMGGGGGGGDRSPLQASKGKLPKIAPRQFTPPTAVINNPDPKLIMDPSIVVQPDAPLPNVASVNFGNPLGVAGPPSNGVRRWYRFW